MKNTYRKIISLLFVIGCISILTGYGQQHIDLDLKKQPLNKALMELSSRYGINISFDNNLLSKYSVTTRKSFESVEEAISFLLRKLPVDYEKSSNVYLIYPSTGKKQEDNDSLTITGTIFDQSTNEPLPYSLLCINNKYLYTNSKGWFNYNGLPADSFGVAVSYLGYQVIDTLIYAQQKSNNLDFYLQPKSIDITEVPVQKSFVLTQPVIGRETGKIKLNPKVASYLPGLGDNSLFQFLTLMPGISQVSGNNSGFSIWGGSPDNVLIDFDGMRIFKPTHFYGNIGMINPLSIKDIEIFKGATSSEYPGAESGLVRLTGKVGNRISPSFTAEINNLTLNALFETPIGRNHSILLGLRGMYRDPESTIFFRQRYSSAYFDDKPYDARQPQNNLHTDYTFGDIHFKFTGIIDTKRSYDASFYQSYDQPVLVPDTATQNNFILSNRMEQKWMNRGMAASYTENLNSFNSLSIYTAYSANSESLFNIYQLKEKNKPNSKKEENKIKNHIENYSFKVVHSWTKPKEQMWKFGLGADYFSVSQYAFRNQLQVVNQGAWNSIYYAFVQNKVTLGKKIELDAGARINYSMSTKSLHISPNLSATAHVSDYLSAGINLGRNQQYLSKIQNVFANYIQNSYYTLSNNEDIPIVKSNQFSSSLNYIRNAYQFTFEAFYKNSHSLSEYVPELIFTGAFDPKIELPGKLATGYYEGESYARGLSLFQKWQSKAFTVWTSYSYTDSKKKFTELYGTEFVKASNFQDHEVKGAAIYQISPFSFTASYLYGSGYNQQAISPNDRTGRPVTFTKSPYNRLDFSMVYNLRFKQFDAEIGGSLLNALNNKNYNYLNFRPNDYEESEASNIYYQINTLPRAICFYVKMKF